MIMSHIAGVVNKKRIYFRGFRWLFLLRRG